MSCNMIQLGVERCGSVSSVCRYVLTIISVTILHKCDETSLTVSHIAVSLTLKGHFPLEATFHVTISMRAQRATGKIQSNNYHHGSCGFSFNG